MGRQKGAIKGAIEGEMHVFRLTIHIIIALSIINTVEADGKPAENNNDGRRKLDGKMIDLDCV